jgi:hypothetical protein
MRLSTKEAIKNVLTREAIFNWLETEQNEVDWAVQHLALDILEGDDEIKEDFYQYIRNLFISILVVGVPISQLPFGALSTLRVTPSELEQHYPMDEEETAYVTDMLTEGKPAVIGFVYETTGPKALLAGFAVGAVLGLGIVALVNAFRK